MKLHLGCGQRYLDGYINIDYPATEHSVQSSLRADVYRDLSTLAYPAGSIDEIRLHHVFEHFPRPAALALLCRWRDWLVPGGTLRIETPDVMASAWLLVSPLVGYEKKLEVVRHLFGSHEAHWAAHWDGWFAERFVRTLNALGFRKVSVTRTRWARLRNVEVSAEKGPQVFGMDDYRGTVRELLSLSLVKSQRRFGFAQPTSPSELEMLEVWMKMWEQAYLANEAPV